MGKPRRSSTLESFAEGEMTLRANTVVPMLRGSRRYPLYVLAVLMLVYLFNQLDRFVLGIASQSIARDLNFAQFGCFPNLSAPSGNASCVGACIKITNHSRCTFSHGVQCQWDYTATGINYEVLAGPAFTLVFTLVAIPLGILAGYKWMNRKVAISVFLVLWSLMTLLAAFTHTYWQLLLTRIGLGLFEAVCTPFASSIISDYFEESFRGTALGFYNWGIYLGYSLAFAFNFILMAIGWRWTFRIAAIPGFPLALLLLLTVREPKRRTSADELKWGHLQGSSVVKMVFRAYLQPVLLLLCVAGGVRQGGGLVWAYNVKAYFEQYYCGHVNVGIYLSWIPLVGGSLGAVVGGYVSDRLARSRGVTARLWVLVVSQLAASPFLIGAIFLPPNPWAFLSLLPAYIVGEMWIGVCLAVVVDLVPPEITTAAIAVFLFIINNIGGTMTLLVPPLESEIGLRYTLVILFPGLYIGAAALFALSLLVLRCRWACVGRRRVETQELSESTALIQNEDSDSDSSVFEPDEEFIHLVANCSVQVEKERSE